MTKTQKYALIVLSIIIVVGSLTQSVPAVIATLVGVAWVKLKGIYWSRALSQMKKPPRGGKKIRIAKPVSQPSFGNWGLAS